MTSHNQPSDDPILPDTPLPKRSTGQRLTALVLVLLIGGIGLLTAQQILSSKPRAQRTPPPKIRPLVETVAVKQATYPLTIDTLGTVLSSRNLSLKPAISGTVQQIHPNLVPGGILHAGDTVLEIDPREYTLEYERLQNDLQNAASDLRLELGSQTVAQREYELIQQVAGIDINDSQAALALREPQLAKAKAALAAVQTEVERAQLDLERTRLLCPFNAVVLTTNVEVGAQVSSQTTIATLAGTDVYWIRAAIPQKDLARIYLPNGSEAGSQVSITSTDAPPGGLPWQGRIIRLLGDVDPKGLMARVLIEVDDPTHAADGRIPLLLGSVVRTVIDGLPMKDCYRVPRQALRPDQTLLVASTNNTLDIRPVTVAWTNDEHAYLTDGLSDGDRVIISPVATPINGMPVTVAAQPTASVSD